MASRGRILTEEEIQRFIDRCNDSGEDSENDVCLFFGLISMIIYSIYIDGISAVFLYVA